MTNLPSAILTAYRELVSCTADEEPVRGWSSYQDLPPLHTADVRLVLEARESEVMDELQTDPHQMAAALKLAAPDKALGAHLFAALERSARAALWYDVLVECERREEERAAEHATDSPEGRRGVASLFRRSHC